MAEGLRAVMPTQQSSPLDHFFCEDTNLSDVCEFEPEVNLVGAGGTGL